MFKNIYIAVQNTQKHRLLTCYKRSKQSQKIVFIYLFIFRENGDSNKDKFERQRQFSLPQIQESSAHIFSTSSHIQCKI